MITNSFFDKDVFGGLVQIRISEKKDGDCRPSDSPDFKKMLQLIRKELNINRIIAPFPAHSGNVALYGEEDLIAGPADIYRTKISVDGYIITTRDSEATAIFYATADCPIVVGLAELSKGHRALAMIHCGWKPLAAGILDNFLDKICSLHSGAMLSQTKIRQSLRILISPGICARCFVVKQDVIDKLSERFPKEYFVNKRIPNGKDRVDLSKIIWQFFNERGVGGISSLRICTKCSGRFFSHRRGDEERNLVAAAFGPLAYPKPKK